MKKLTVKILVAVMVVMALPVSAFAYSSSNAINYSNQYALSPNLLNASGQGYDVFVEDCTNYVSQCLFAGGLAQDSVWYSYVEWHANAPRRVNSVAWKNSDTLKNYLKNYGKAYKIGSWSKAGTPAPYQTYPYVKNSSNLTASNQGKVIIF